MILPSQTSQHSSPLSVKQGGGIKGSKRAWMVALNGVWFIALKAVLCITGVEHTNAEVTIFLYFCGPKTWLQININI